MERFARMGDSVVTFPRLGRSRAPLAAAALLPVLALALTACGGGSSKSTEIIVEGPMSGPQAATGTDMRNAAQLAVDQANASGGILGRKIKLVSGDDKADPSAGEKVAKQAVKDGDFAVIGPYNSSVGIVNLKTYVNGGVIPIHLTSDAATDGLGYTVQPKNYQVAPVEAKAITGYLKARKVAIVYDTSTYTVGIAKQLRAALTAAGAKVVLYQSLTPKNLDAGALVGRIKATKPDLFYSSTYFPQGGKIAKTAAARGLKATCFMGLANQDADFVKTAGLAAARRCYASGVPSAEQFAEARAYVSDYRKKFGTAPGTWGTFTYDSVRLLFASVRKAGAWDTKRVESELSKTTGYKGITGTITINPKTGDRRSVPVVILRIGAKGQYLIDPKWAKFAGFSL